MVLTRERCRDRASTSGGTRPSASMCSRHNADDFSLGLHGERGEVGHRHPGHLAEGVGADVSFPVDHVH